MTTAKERGKQAQKHGKQGDEVGVAALGRMGILQLHRVATPYIRIPHPVMRSYCRIVEIEKVAGDWTGLLPNGVSVLAEIKTHFGENLAWSDFKPHQPGILSAHAEIAVALLVFVHDYGVNVMRWPVPGFDRPRCSITPARAMELDIQHQPLINLMTRNMTSIMQTTPPPVVCPTCGGRIIAAQFAAGFVLCESGHMILGVFAKE